MKIRRRVFRYGFPLALWCYQLDEPAVLVNSYYCHVFFITSLSFREGAGLYVFRLMSTFAVSRFHSTVT